MLFDQFHLLCNLAGPMTFDGAVTMGAGLTVTAGNTVDGVDIEDLDAGILRLSVEQDVSGEINHLKKNPGGGGGLFTLLKDFFFFFYITIIQAAVALLPSAHILEMRMVYLFFFNIL